MTDDEAQSASVESSDLEDDGVLDAADTLEGNLGDDPLDQGIAAQSGGRPGSGTEPRWASSGQANRSTNYSPRRNPSTTPTRAMRPRRATPRSRSGRTRSSTGCGLDDSADPRAGRLVAEDEGAHEDEESDLVARDVGIDGGGAGAEEAAVHVVDQMKTGKPDLG